MDFNKLTLEELSDKVRNGDDFMLVIEETENKSAEVLPNPERTIKTLISKINTFEPCSQDIYYFLNDDKLNAKIAIGLVTEDRTNLMYWSNKKPKFSFYLEEALEIFA